MNIKKTVLHGVCTYYLSGRFTFSDHQAFQNIINSIKNAEAPSIAIELSRLEFIDSAALGMFLVARDEAKKNKTDLKLVAPAGHVQKMFNISNFYGLFNIVYTA